MIINSRQKFPVDCLAIEPKSSFSPKLHRRSWAKVSARKVRQDCIPPDNNRFQRFPLHSFSYSTREANIFHSPRWKVRKFQHFDLSGASCERAIIVRRKTLAATSVRDTSRFLHCPTVDNDRVRARACVKKPCVGCIRNAPINPQMRPVGTVSAIRHKLICIIKRLSSSTMKDGTRKLDRDAREKERETKGREKGTDRRKNSVDSCAYVLRVATIGRIDNGIPLGRCAIGQDFRRVRDA